MSEFKFLCPECDQKILGDTAYSGTQIVCPTCQKSITIPAAPPTAPPAAAIPPTASRPASSPSAAISQKQPAERVSKLAVASLVCSVFVPVGAVPGLICGHLAKARMRRNIFLTGEKMAGAGLLISYCVLMATLAVAGIGLLENLHYRPVRVIRDSPEALAALQPRVVDAVIMGDNEDDHEVDGQMDYTTEKNGKSFHTATRGGTFSYTMKVLPDEAMALNCRYWGSETKNHIFDIAVEGQVIATQNLTALAPGHYVDMEYKIPASLTRGKTQVKVEFQAHAGMTAGGLYACQILKW